MALTLAGKLEIDVDLSPILRGETHGVADKDMIVLHETVSPDYVGLNDIVQTSEFLSRRGLGIHAVVDVEGHLGWAYGMRRAVVYHTTAADRAPINTRSIGIEQVSRVMLDYPDNPSRWSAWRQRRVTELEVTAKLCAYLSKAEGVPLRYSNGAGAGITTHWQVTRTFDVPGGHVDCWPKHLGGYYPVMWVIYRARHWRRAWWPS